MIIRSKYKLLCIKAMQDQISDDDFRVLNKWLQKSKENQAYYNNLKKTWDKMGTTQVNHPPVNVKEEWTSFEKAINTGGFKTARSLANQTKLVKDTTFLTIKKYLSWKPVYISAAILLILSSIIYIYMNNPGNKIQAQTFTAANKQKVNVQLSDGSSIQLNSGSSVTVLEDPSEQSKEIKLEGEAYFKMAKQKNPCYILTDNARIEIVGTAFNVWSRNDETRVIVKEGLVRLSSNTSNNEFVLLSADEMSAVVANSQPAEAESVNTEKYLGWTSGKLVFEHAPLNEIIAEIERQYDVNIKITSENMKDLSITGTFENLDIKQVLSSVCLALDLEYKNLADNTFILSRKEE
ncbi:MAG: FecR domain-containing protein [Calditrichaceae bacterium]|jgi:transmembrane sensor